MKKIVASILTAVFSIGILAGCTDYEIHEVPGTYDFNIEPEYTVMESQSNSDSSAIDLLNETSSDFPVGVSDEITDKIPETDETSSVPDIETQTEIPDIILQTQGDTINRLQMAWEKAGELANLWTKPEFNDLENYYCLYYCLAQYLKYDYKFQYGCHTAYNALLNGSAVCDGFAYAYQMLCARKNLYCDVVVSVNHAWNIVRLADSYYYVDIQQDFLMSDATIEDIFTFNGIDIDTSDIKFINGNSAPKCTDDKYGDAYIILENELQPDNFEIPDSPEGGKHGWGVSGPVYEDYKRNPNTDEFAALVGSSLYIYQKDLRIKCKIRIPSKYISNFTLNATSAKITVRVKDTKYEYDWNGNVYKAVSIQSHLSDGSIKY